MEMTIAEKILAAHTNAREVRPGDIVKVDVDVALANDITAPIAIKAAGVSCVVAKSFARIFYRNAFNMGLPIFESKDLADALSEGREIVIDSTAGIIKVAGSDQSFSISPIPPFMEQLIADGGLMKHIAKKK